MNSPSLESNQLASILNQIREGMRVVDRDQDEVGKVSYVYLGAVNELEDELAPQAADAPEPGILAGAGGPQYAVPVTGMAGEDAAPKELRERLRRNGYIRINTRGWFASDRYAMPDQIASVSDETVNLRVSREDLLKK